MSFLVPHLELFQVTRTIKLPSYTVNLYSYNPLSLQYHTILIRVLTFVLILKERSISQ